MTKTFSILFLFLFLASCGKGGGGGSGASGSAVSDATTREINASTDDAQDMDVPTDAFTFDVDAKLSGFSASQEAKVEDAIELIKKVVV